MFGFSMSIFEIRGMKRIFNECFAYLHKHSYRFFANNFSGSLVKKMNKLAYSFESFMDMFSYEIVRMVIALPFIIIAISVKNQILGLVFL
jgi:ATP-binding cassette subfamily B protein